MGDIVVVFLTLFTYFLDAAIKLGMAVLLFAGVAFLRSKVPVIAKSKKPSRFWAALKAFWVELKKEL